MRPKRITIWINVEPKTDRILRELADKTKRTLGGTVDWVVQSFASQEAAKAQMGPVATIEPADGDGHE